MVFRRNCEHGEPSAAAHFHAPAVAMSLCILIAIAVTVLATSMAEARPCIRYLSSGAHAYVETSRACIKKSHQRSARRHAHHGRHLERASGRPRAWCGWWMAQRHGLNDRSLWLAVNWARVGQRASGPARSVIGVMRHHVYEVLEVLGPGRVLAISGNDGGRVRIRARSTQGTFAWRRV